MLKLLLAFCSSACILISVLYWSVPKPLTSASFPAYDLNNVAEAEKPTSVDFKDTTLEWQIFPSHFQSSKKLSALTETLGAGICALDANKDGWTDLFFLGGSGHTRHYGRKSWWHQQGGNRLFINHKGQFLQALDNSGLELNQWSMGCSAVDLNNDGWQDIIVSGLDTLSLFKNEGLSSGAPKFVNLSKNSGLTKSAWSTSITPGDFNNDGLIDLYVSNYIRYQKGARTFEKSKGFETADVAFDASLYDPLPNKLFVNKGQFKFEDVTEQMGVDDTLGRSLDARWHDLNGDNWLDLIVINSSGSPNQVYINNQGQSFSRASEKYTSLETPESHSSSSLSINGQDSILISRNQGLSPVLAMQNPADGKFIDQAWKLALASEQRLHNSSWGIATGDFDNNGFDDIFLANGATNPDIDTPFVARGQKNQIFLGSKTQFLSQAIDDPALSARAAISADLNNDGKLELILSNNNNALSILQGTNNETNNWIGFDLLTNNLTQDSFGATIHITTENSTLKKRFSFPNSFLSSSEQRLHFGLGNSTTIKNIEIRWPDNQVDNLGNLEVNRYYSLVKGKPKSSKLLSEAQHSDIKQLSKSFNDAARLELFHIYSQLNTPSSFEKLISLWKTSNNKLKLAMLTNTEITSSKELLYFVQQSLESNSFELKSAAIEILRKLEWEHGTYWLLKLFDNEAKEIKCEIAKTFKFFFAEEEAVTHRKYLATPYLIRLLEHPDPELQICAANALAESERKRAILALVSVVRSNTSIEAKAASIRALGLIRDTKAITLLKNIVLKPNDFPASIVAESFIALKRLNYPEIDFHLQQLAASKPAKSTTKEFHHKHNIANILLAHPESLVFEQKLIRDLSNSFVKDNEFSDKPEQQNSIAQLGTIRLNQDEKYLTKVLKFASHPDKKIREQAFVTLTYLAKSTPTIDKAVWSLLVSDNDADSILEMLDKSKASSVNLPKSVTEILVSKLETRLQQANIYQQLSSLNQKSTFALFDNLLNQDKFHDAFINLCLQHTNPIPFLLSKLQAKPGNDNIKPILTCFYSDGVFDQLDSRTLLRLRLVLKDFIEAENVKTEDRHHMLIRAAQYDRTAAETLLIKKIPEMNVENKISSLRIFDKHELGENVEALIKEYIANKNIPLELTLAAIRSLMQFNLQSSLTHLAERSLIDVEL